MVAVEGIRWIRLLYVYPENISDEFVEFMASNEKIVKYLDIPVQHASNSILKSMNRDVSKEEIESTIRKLRVAIPDIAIRTSVMVGFPGETDSDFNELKSFVEEMNFDHLGCFSYSQEEGTVAGRMKDQISEEIKADRLDQVMAVQKSVSSQNLEKYVGTVQDVLITGVSEETELLMEGRLATQAPEVDGIVYINDGDVQVGEIQKVYISESHEYDLVGRVITVQ